MSNNKSFSINSAGGWKIYSYNKDIKDFDVELFICITPNEFMNKIADEFQEIHNLSKTVKFNNYDQMKNLISKTFFFIEKYKNEVDSYDVFGYLELVLVAYLYYKPRIGENFFYSVFDNYLLLNENTDKSLVFMFAVDFLDLFKQTGYISIIKKAINFDPVDIYPQDTYLEELKILCDSINKNFKDVVLEKLSKKYNKKCIEILEKKFNLFNNDELQDLLLNKEPKLLKMNFENEHKKLDCLEELANCKEIK